MTGEINNISIILILIVVLVAVVVVLIIIIIIIIIIISISISISIIIIIININIINIQSTSIIVYRTMRQRIALFRSITTTPIQERTYRSRFHRRSDDITSFSARMQSSELIAPTPERVRYWLKVTIRNSFCVACSDQQNYYLIIILLLISII